MKHIENPTKTMKLHAIMNKCLDAKNGHATYEEAVLQIISLLRNERSVRQWSQALGDYTIGYELEAGD